MSTKLQPITKVSGTGVVVRGNDIDTDRIIPARFMKVVTFDGIEQFVFDDVRTDENGNKLNHPFDDPAYQGASVLFVNDNFGCGSSREHAPQALTRWGINAIIGESFAEIFYGNCVSLGVPCLTLPKDELLKIMQLVEGNASEKISIDLETGAVTIDSLDEPVLATLEAGPRQRFLSGAWDALSVLLDADKQISETAARLPYISGF